MFEVSINKEARWTPDFEI